MMQIKFKKTAGTEIRSTFLSLLSVFIIFKLTNVIDWNWIWILSPLWLPIALGQFLWLIVVLVDFFYQKTK